VTIPSLLELELLRNVGDDLADNAVAAFFADVEQRSPGELFGQLVRHVKLPEEAQVPSIQKFFAEAGRQPAWIDAAAVARGQEFFNRLVIHQFTALYLSSLPNSYAAAKGVQVLRLTGRLQTDTMRRLNETGQFLMDIAGPNAMCDGGVGIDRILHVRLMHAAVRWMILHDPLVTRVTDLAPPVTETDELIWSSSWGIPANQEDLLGTWLTFTAVVYDAFDASGVDYSEQNLADHLHLWRLVAHYLGIKPDLIPTNRSDADVLRERIFGSQQAASGAGNAMTAALVVLAQSRMPRFAWPMMPTAFRHFLGDSVSDMIGIPPANWTRHLFGVLSAVTKITTRGEERHVLHARISSFIGRHLLDGILKDLRQGNRPMFEIPTHLINGQTCLTNNQ
jgi:ER-bound oxygenase mpaB/B'/Rubber oxygenase, catalytic domain